MERKNYLDGGQLLVHYSKNKYYNSFYNSELRVSINISNAKHSSDLEWKESEKIFNAVVNNDIEGIKLCLAEEVNVNVTDEQVNKYPMYIYCLIT